MMTFQRSLAFIAMLFIGTFCSTAQDMRSQHENDPSPANPYGRAHPDAPEQVRDFEKMMGVCDCKSVRRNPDQSWGDTLELEWRFKYILNGWGVQDETWIGNGTYATSIRQFQPDSGYWVVSYHSSGSVATQPRVWLGGNEGKNIVLRQPQTAPGRGIPGISQLTFYGITEEGFRWKGEWIDSAGTIVYPFWMIDCRKRIE